MSDGRLTDFPEMDVTSLSSFHRDEGPTLFGNIRTTTATRVYTHAERHTILLTHDDMYEC